MKRYVMALLLLTLGRAQAPLFAGPASYPSEADSPIG